MNSNILHTPNVQPLKQAPHEGRNAQGDIVSDSIESSGIESEWESSGDLPPNQPPAPAGVVTEQGYSSGPADYEDIARNRDPDAALTLP